MDETTLLLDNSNGCAECGAPLLPGGLCPACALALADESKAANDSPEVPGYRLIEEVGRGGMGVVWLAEHAGTRRRVAVKFLHPSGFDREAHARFQREVRLAARLDHEGIARVYDGGEAGGQPFYAMEYVEGESLSNHVRAKTPGLRGCVALVREVAEAVQHAHARLIIHRDLKPSNIRIGADGHPRVLDFGLAKALDEAAELSQTGQRLGTPLYMSPEQAAGADAGMATDVYALAVILYELLTGRLPHGGSGGTEAVLHRILHEEPVRPRLANTALDSDIEMLLLRALARDPAQRYRNAGEFADELARWLAGEPLLAGRATPFYFAQKWLRRHWLAASAAALVLIAAAGGAAFYVFNIRAERDKVRKSEAEALRLLAETFARGAEAAAQRGQWGVAIENLDRALAGGHPEQIELRLLRARALEAALRSTELQAELRALADAPMTPGQRTRLKLLLADNIWLTSDGGTPQKMILECLAEGLPPVDAAYARAAIAETGGEAINHAREVLRLDPFHHGGRSMLCCLLAYGGQSAEATEHARIGELLFPSDGGFPGTHAWILACAGRMDEAMKLADATPALDRTARESLKTACMSEEMFRTGLLDFADFAKMKEVTGARTAIIMRMMSSPIARADGTRLLGAMRLPAYLGESRAKAAVALVKASMLNTKEAVADLQAAIARHREASLFFMLGLVHAAADQSVEASAAFQEAARLPGIYPELPARSLAVAAMLESVIAVEAKTGKDQFDPVAMRRSVDLFRAAHLRGPLKDIETHTGFFLSLRLGEFDLARSILAAAPANFPKRAEFGIIVEQRAGNLPLALARADAAIAAHPGDKALRELRAKVVAGVDPAIGELERLRDTALPRSQ